MNTNAAEWVPDMDWEWLPDAEQYAYRPGRNAQQAVVEVGAVLDHGHPEVVDADLANGASLEDQIREFVHKDNPPMHGSMESSDSAVNGVCWLIHRVAGATLGEIDNMIVELQQLRVFLVNEGERLQRELADYEKLIRVTLRSSRIITDILPSRKLIADNTGTN